MMPHIIYAFKRVGALGFNVPQREAYVDVPLGVGREGVRFGSDADFRDDSLRGGNGACFAGRAAALVEFGDGKLACESATKVFNKLDCNIQSLYT